MIVRFVVILPVLSLVGCGLATPPPDTARLPPGVFGQFDNDVPAANQAAWAFASPERTAGNPVEAARASAAIDYLAGELSSNPRWVSVSPLTKMEMLQARLDVRRALGIAADTRSQIVVDALLSFAAAWQAGARAAAMRALSAPGLTMAPDRTLQVLSNMPYIQSANVGSTDTARQVLPFEAGHGLF